MSNKPKTYLIDAPAGKLEVSAIWQQKASRLAILCHPHPLFGGTMNNKIVTTMARFCDAQGFHVLRFNFRGVGQSTGEFDNTSGELEDAKAVLAWASTQSHIKKLWLGGFSFGGFIAAKLANAIASEDALSHYDVVKLTMVAPAVERYEMIKLHIPTERTHLIYGNDDDVVDPQVLANFAKKTGLTPTVFDGVGHYFHGNLGKLTKALQAHEG